MGSERVNPAKLNEEERAAVMGARLIRRLHKDSWSSERVADVLAAALLLADQPALAKRMKP